jgi:hypothetical protein
MAKSMKATNQNRGATTRISASDYREVHEAMRQQRQRPAGLLILADRHPGSLQHEIGNDVLHGEKQHPSYQRTYRDRGRHRRKQQS